MRKTSLWGRGSRRSITSYSRDDNIINACNQKYFGGLRSNSKKYDGVSHITNVHEQDNQGGKSPMPKNTINHSPRSIDLCYDHKKSHIYPDISERNQSSYQSNTNGEKTLTLHENPLSNTLHFKLKRRSKTPIDLFSIRSTKTGVFRRWSEPNITLECETATKVIGNHGSQKRHLMFNTKCRIDDFRDVQPNLLPSEVPSTQTKYCWKAQKVGKSSTSLGPFSSSTNKPSITPPINHEEMMNISNCESNVVVRETRPLVHFNGLFNQGIGNGDSNSLNTSTLTYPTLIAPNQALKASDPPFHIAALAKNVDENQKRLPDIGIFRL